MAKPARSLSIGFLFDDTLDSNDGVAQQVKSFGEWLSSQGHQVSYLVGQTTIKQWRGGQVYSLAHNIRVIFNGNRLSVPLSARRRLIKRLLNDKTFDVLHVQMPHSPFMSQMIINRADPRTGIVGTFHVVPANWLASIGAKVLARVYGRRLKRIDKVLSVSQPALVFAYQAFGLRSQILPNVIDVKKFSHSSSVDKRTDHIVFLGRLVKRKGSYELLKAFRIFHEGHPRARLTIAGSGPERSKLESYVRRHHLEKVVDFPGFIREKDKPALLASAGIACFPSLYGESFGIVLLEAMAAGAGVVLVGNNPGYISVLGDRSELLIDPKNTSAFAAQLAKLTGNQQLVSELHAWQSVEVKKYDIETVGPQLIAIYAEAIAKRPPSGHNLSHAA